MRIIGYLEHPNLKITVFKMANKLSVKFENSLYEQTYKFRDGQGGETLEDVTTLVDEAFLAGVQTQLVAMHRLNQEALGRRSSTEEEEFEQII